jgi:4-diphosphocytidyl-2C-methyl-D-erythritol kinase
MADLVSVWGTPVSLTGSGSACFGYFATPEEAADAVSAVSDFACGGRGVALRDHGVARVDNLLDE